MAKRRDEQTPNKPSGVQSAKEQWQRAWQSQAREAEAAMRAGRGSPYYQYSSQWKAEDALRQWMREQQYPNTDHYQQGPGPYRPPMPPNNPPVYQPNAPLMPPLTPHSPFAIPQRRSEAAMAYQQAAQDTWRQMQASRVGKNKPPMPSPAMPSPVPKKPGFSMPKAGPLPQGPRNLQPTPSPQAAPLQTRFQQKNSNESFGLPKSNPSIKNMEENKMSKAKSTPKPSLSQFTPRFERPKKGPY